MLESFTTATFAEHLGETFRIDVGAAEPLRVELIEAATLGGGSAEAWAAGGRRAPFSIVFRGPIRPVLPQRIYRMEHDATGAFELFLVPIGPDQGGMRYEAIFT